MFGSHSQQWIQDSYFGGTNREYCLVHLQQDNVQVPRELRLRRSHGSWPVLKGDSPPSDDGVECKIQRVWSNPTMLRSSREEAGEEMLAPADQPPWIDAVHI